MRARSGTTVALLLALAGTGCFWLDRPNPRLKQATRVYGDVEETLTLSYDDAGHLTAVENVERAATTTLAIAWEDNLVVGADVEKDPANEAFPTEKSALALTWEDGRLVRAKETFEDATPDDGLDAPVQTSTIAYDDGGRIARLTQEKAANGASVEDVTSFELDDRALLVAVRSTLRVLVEGDETSKSETMRTLETTDGVLSRMTIDNDGDVTTLDVTLDGNGRVDAFEVTFVREAAPDEARHAVVGFSYDEEDRLIAMTVSDDDGLTDDPLTELSYDDGEAADLDVTPYTIFPYGLWDLAGKSHLTLDARTQAARFVLPIW